MAAYQEGVLGAAEQLPWRHGEHQQDPEAAGGAAAGVQNERDRQAVSIAGVDERQDAQARPRHPPRQDQQERRPAEVDDSRPQEQSRIRGRARMPGLASPCRTSTPAAAADGSRLVRPMTRQARSLGAGVGLRHGIRHQPRSRAVCMSQPMFMRGRAVASLLRICVSPSLKGPPPA